MGDIRISAVTGDPFILFRGSGNNITDIQLDVLTDYQSANGSGTSLVFNGTEGQLFAITDNLSSGVIYSVSDIGGLPLLEIDASGDVRIAEYGRYVGIGTGEPEYQLDVYGTGKFHSGVMFPDGNIQTIAYTGGASSYSWDVQVTGVSETINSNDTVTFTGDGNTSVTFDPSTNTVTISGSGGGGSTYTAGSGLALDGTEFYLNNTGTLDNLLFSDIIRIGNSYVTGNGSVVIANNDPSDHAFEPATNNTTNSIIIGRSCFYSGTGALNSVFIGRDVGRESVNTINTIGIGTAALDSINDTTSSIFIGTLSALRAENVDYSICIGDNAGNNTVNANTSIIIGRQAGQLSLDTTDSIILGPYAGFGADLSTDCVSVGRRAGGNISGEKNIYIGYNAGNGVIGNNNIEIVSSGENSSILNGFDNTIHIQNIIAGNHNDGKLAIGSVDSGNFNPDSTLQVVNNTSSNISFIVDAAASQSADMTQWRDSSLNVLSLVDNNGNFGIQKTSASYQLDVAGTGNFESGVRYPDGEVQTVAYKGSSKSVVTITNNHSASTTEDFILVDASSSDITITLPNVSSASGNVIGVKKIDSSANDITITGDANIDGQASASINYQYESVYLVTDGNEWYKM